VRSWFQAFAFKRSLYRYVLVMLHELVHNDIGPHNKAFFKLLAEITEECEALMVGLYKLHPVAP
jgi:predicted metal-dependent hydrolase